jgi:hypothetical protein
MQDLIKSLLPLGLVFLATGCGPADRQAILIGQWAASSTAGLAMSVKLSKDAKSNSDAYKGGKALAATGVEIKKDGTFMLVWAGHQCQGDWTFDKQSGEVALKVKSAEPLLPTPAAKDAPAFKPQTYTAYLDEDNSRLRFLPVPPDIAKTMDKNGPGLSGGIPLEKK